MTVSLANYKVKLTEKCREICTKRIGFGEGGIYASQRMDILETNYAEGLWKLENGDSFAESALEQQVRASYEIRGYMLELDSDFAREVLDELQLFTGKDLNAEVVTLSKGEKLTWGRYYPDGENGWLEIVYNNYESTGWLYLSGNYKIYQKDASGEVVYPASYELINNLCMAD